LDPDHRLVVCVVPGKRTAENTTALVRDFRRRTSGRLMDLITTDEYAPYRGAILESYGETVTPPRSGKRGRPRKSYKVPPAGLTYATVHKTRAKGRVVKVEQRVIFGTAAGVGAALARSASSRAINTSFVERQNGPQPQRPEGPQDLLLLEGLVGAPGDHVLHDVQLQFLLAGADPEDQGRG
jgi:hypothetical protein